jgi:predicted deacylase
MDKTLSIGGTEVPLGIRTTLDLSVAKLYTHTPMTMPLHVIRGRREGARLFVSAAIHGDELNGVEIIRRLVKLPVLHRLRGTLLAIPVVNVFGLLHHSRYLPDRRDLNRSFPGSDRGSLAARLANIFMTEIVSNCTHGIDLHTGAAHRSNLPQIRANVDDEETVRLARAFGAPVTLNANLRDGSLRQAAADFGIPMLLYEAGEALRFEEVSIRAGVRGVVSVMRELGMLPRTRSGRSRVEHFVSRSSSWVRSPVSGILRSATPLGARVRRGALLGVVTDPYGQTEVEVHAHTGGVVVGRMHMPLVSEGDALFHIARFEDASEVAEQVEAFHVEYSQMTLEDSELPIV